MQDKKDAILVGEFLFRMDGEEVVLKAGDTLEVPKGHVHYAEVVGNRSCVDMMNARVITSTYKQRFSPSAFRNCVRASCKLDDPGTFIAAHTNAW